MNGLGFLMVGLGAALGAWSRWWLGVSFNSVFPTIPLGTLLANLVGGYLIGLIFGVVQTGWHISPEMKLLILTGFLGGLTTFSTFSIEATDLLLKEQYMSGLFHISLHLFGSLIFTILGLYSAKLILA